MTDLDRSIKDLTRELVEITEKHDEKALLLDAMSESAPCLMWAKDLHGRYLYANQKHMEWLGAMPEEDIRGMTDYDFAVRNRSLMPNDDNYHTFGEVCLNSDTITLQRGEPCRFLEAGNVRGFYCALQVFKAPLKDKHGKLIGTVGTGVDVTERIQVREKLLHDLYNVIEEHGIREPFKPLLERFKAYCDRHKFERGQEY